MGREWSIPHGFLMRQTYVDRTTAGVNTEEDLVRIYRELEKIAANGGFSFKETLMSGVRQEARQQEESAGSDRGHRTGLAAGRCEVNFSGKKRGARTKPDEDLEELETFVPEMTTKRALCRVVMGQYNPLGLLGA